MAGLEADTSSYNQPLPAAPLDVAKSIQQFDLNNLNISKQKLELVSQQFGVMNNELANLIDSNASKEQAAERLTKVSKTLGIPDNVTKHMMDELSAAPDVKSFANNAIRRGMSTMEKYGVQYGTRGEEENSATKFQGVRQSPEKGGGFVPATQVPTQPPPTQGTVDTVRTLPNGQPNPNFGQPRIIGATAPSGVYPVAPPAALPVTPQAPAATASPVRAPVTVDPKYRAGLPAERPAPPPQVSGPTGPTVQTGHNFEERFGAAFPNRIATGLAPGTAAAIGAVSEQSGKDFARDLTVAKNLQSELYPAERALELVKSQGPKAFGPGTEGLNTIKSAIATWLPNVDQKTIDSVSEFEQTRKYLTQIARASGATGTNDQLAAAFEANPSVKLNSASIENVLKSVITLRKMQAAQTLMAVNQNIPREQYSEWIAKNQNQFDARAFGVDMMDDRAKAKLYDSLKKDPKAYQKFEKTIQFAHDAQLVGQ